MKLFLFLLLATSLPMMACKTPGYTAETIEKSHIRFGAGGGFTGLIDTYYLMENGDLYHGTSRDTALTRINRAESAQVETIFNFVETIGAENFAFSQPANYYQFVELHLGKAPIVCVFNRQNPSSPTSLVQLYDRLNQLIAPPTE